MTDLAIDPGVAAATREEPVTRDLAPVVGAARRAAMFVLALLLAALAWEAYKAVGPSDGLSWRGSRVLPRTDDASMPHVWSVLQAYGHQEVAVAGSRTVGAAVLSAAWFTGRLALGGVAIGAVVGLLLALAMQRARVVELGLMPWVILSQTVPLVALAPLVVGWGGRLRIGTHPWQAWMSVMVVSGYLAFCPVAVGALRGLQSPAPASVELFRSCAAGWWQTTARLRLPAALPFLVPALRLAAAAAVVGAIVAEISTGTRGGIGRLIIEYAQVATSDPTRMFAAILGAAALGLVLSGLVSLLDLALRAARGGAAVAR